MPYERRMWIIGLGIVLFLAACDKGQIFHRLRPNAVILAFGDSLTFGSGTEDGLSYPAQLEKLIRRKVVNAGVAGESSADGARRLPRVLTEHEPDLVILGLGGNVQPQRLDRQQLQSDLRRMFEIVTKRGIPVVMIAASQPGLAATGVDLYEELAQELKIPLVHAPLGYLMLDPQNPDAQIHRNEENYRKLAEAVVEVLYKIRAI